VRQELGRTLPDAALRALHQRTGGNPRFLRLLLREVAGRSGTDAERDPARTPLPESVRDAVEQRLQPLSAPCREALTWASVIGLGFSFSLLEQVSGCEVHALLELLMEAAAAHIIEPEHAERIDVTTRSHGSYRFTHALIRETLYHGLDPADRVKRHHAVGEALERFASSDPDTISALARHLYEASQGTPIEGATAWCLRAAHLALAHAQHDHAVAHLEHAHSLESKHPDADPGRTCAIQLALGDALRRAGQRRRSLRSFLAAVTSARALERSDLLALAVLGLGQLVRRRTAARAMFALDDARLRQHRVDLLAMADEALAGLPDAQLALRARVLAMRSHLEAGLGRRVPIAHLEEPLSLARRSSDPRALFDTLLAKRMSLQGPSNQERALAVSNELMHLGLAAGARPLIFTACELRIPLHLAAGDMSSADQDIALACRIARELESPRQELTIAQFQLGRRLGDGNGEETRRLLKRVTELSRDDDSDVRFLYKGVLLWMTCAEGRGLMARTAVEQMRARQDEVGAAMHAVLGHYFWAVGDRRQAAEHFDQAAQHDFTDVPYTDGWLWTLATCADLASRLRDARRARRLASLIAPHARLNISNPMHCYRGSASHVLARLALVQGDQRAARDHFELALDFNRKIGAIPSLLLTQYHFGRLLLKGSDPDRRRGRELLAEVSSGASASAISGLLRRSDLQGVSPARG
jgi:tetratricopeptide (TPR) repeat protein